MKPSLQAQFKALAARVHRNHPLPLSRQELQRLHGVLNQVFQRELDLAHPQPIAAATATTSPSPTWASPLSRKPGLTSRSGQSKLATTTLQSPAQTPFASVANHLENILSSPLLSPDSPRLSSGHPVEKFKLAVARGQADLAGAIECLRAAIGNSYKTWTPSRRDSVAQLRSATGVVHWLWSNSLLEGESLNCLYKESEFWTLLAAGLVVEGRQDIFKKCLRLPFPAVVNGAQHRPISASTASRDANGLIHRAVAMKRRFLNTFVIASVRFGTDYDTLVPQYCEMLKSCQENLQAAAPHSGFTTSSIVSSGLLSLIRSISRPGAKVHYQTYNALTEVLPQLLQSSSHLLEHCLAILQLYHPVKPDPIPVMAYLRRRVFDSSSPVAMTSKEDKHHFKLALDAAELLLAKEQVKEASWLLHASKSRFAQNTDQDVSETKSRELPSSPPADSYPGSSFTSDAIPTG